MSSYSLYIAWFFIDEYHGTKVPGEYAMSVKVDYANGTTEMVNLNLTVVAQQFTYTPPTAWYKTWNGWVSQWFGVRIAINWLLNLLGIHITV